ncbi:uncharacterized protein TrAtP1_002873 [Trichoderma atroviride]|nr:hypothetical protein TrAtP1_002873 [Trichoderma atroviride]
MTSRKEQDIDLKIRALLSLPARQEIDLLARQDTLDNDICQYINSTLATDDFMSWKDDVKEEVRQALIKKADSMFQYVRFQLEILQEISSPAEIREALLDLPVGLDATYDRILENINAKFRGRVINSLKWLAFSREVLNIEQLTEIFIINPNDNIAFDEQMRLSSPMDVLKYFSGLVIFSRVQYGPAKVRLVHFSAKEYLTSSRIENRPTSAFSFTEINAHEHIVRSCLAYLTYLDTIIEKYTEFNKMGVERAYPLIQYVADNWALHLEEIPRASWSAKVLREARLALATGSQSLFTQLVMKYSSSNNMYMLMKPYCYTAQHGFLQLTETLLSQELGANKYLTQEDLDFGLQHAAYGGNTDMAQLFLEAGAKVSVYYGKSKWYSALHAAASGSHPNILEFLIAHGGADFNAYTSLLPLVSRRDTKSVNFLLDHGVNIDAQDGHQRTALHSAIRNGDSKRISLLLQKGANVNVLSGTVGTPLHAACTLRYDDLHLSPSIGYIQMLLHHGADPNIRAGEYATAIQALCYTGLSNDYIEHKEIETILIPLLIKHGADVSAQGGKYGTALHAAAAASLYSKHADCVMRLLLDNGAKVDQPGGDIWGTALQLACSEGTMEAVRFLLDHGADVNAQGGSRFGTPLQAAAWRENGVSWEIYCQSSLEEKISNNFTLQNKIQILELLLSKGARVNQQGGEWGSALQAACRHPNVEVLRLLLDHGADVNASGGMNGPALTIACSVNEFEGMARSRECIQLLLGCGAHVNAQSEENGTALAAACGVYLRDVERVQLLLSHGADVNAQCGKYGTALMAACQEGEDRYDQQRTAACRGEDRYGQLRTALYRGEDGRCIDFYSQGSVPVAQLLLDRGADVNALGGIHGTALSAACSWSHSELVQLLLEHGADIHLQDCAAWHEAARCAVFRCGGDMALLALLNHGMHVNHVNQDYGTALHAIMGEYEFAPEGTTIHEYCGAFYKHGRYDKSAAEGENWRRSFDILIKHGMDTSIVSERLGSALYVACETKLDGVHKNSSHWHRGCANINCTSRKTKYLLEQVPDIDVNVRGGIFGSPLQAAAYSGQALSVKMLLDRKASVNVRGGKYRSALNGAIIGDHWDIVEVLLEAGATPDCDLEEEPDEEWLQTVLKEEGRGAVERYRKFWNVEMEKKSEEIHDLSKGFVYS